MTIKRISILNEFKCTGAACPSNCCRGWKIPIDDNAYIKYINEKGLLGFALRCFIEKKEELTSFRSGKRTYKCPFWGIDKLCTLQKSRGIDYMPLVCAQFPRQLSNFGSFCEETLQLSCIEAARLFILQALENKPFEFENTEGEAAYEKNTTNDDFDFLDYLLKSRSELIKMLENDCGFNMAILEYGRDAQNICLNMFKNPAPLPSPLDYDASQYEKFSADSSTMHTLFFKGFYHPTLKHSAPLLYKLCNKYIREFGVHEKSRKDASDEKLANLMESVYKKFPGFGNIKKYYYEYYLQKNFLYIFEDYSFIKHLLLGMAQAQMLQLFTALYAKNKNAVSIDALAEIIAVYERRAPQIEDALKVLITKYSA